MSRVNVEQLRIVQAKPKVAGARIGKIVALHEGNVAMVDYPGNPLGPHAAQAGSRIVGMLLEVYNRQLPVLLIFEDDDPARPVIMDVLLTKRNELEADHANGRLSIEDDNARSSGAASPAAAARVALITAVEEDGVIVQAIGEGTSPMKARTAIRLRNLKDPVVVLVISERESVIVGQLYDRVPIEPEGGSDAEVILKGSRIKIEADVELVLQSGACRVQLDARGKVVTIANQIVSRARESNKVQGASIQLN